MSDTQQTGSFAVPGCLWTVEAHRTDAWNDLLRSIGTFDFYHTAEYHQTDAATEAGSKPELIAYAEEQNLVLLPLVFRPIVLGEQTASGLSGLFDARSVYGYSGLLASPGVSEDCLKRFTVSLKQCLYARRVVSVFSRLHPYKATCFPQPCVGDVSAVGKTVAIDLAGGISDYEAGLAKGHRYEIRRLRESGCTVSCNSAALRLFTEVYNETMSRLGAEPHYFFDQAYFDRFSGAKSYETKIYLATYGGDIAAMALFTRCCKLVQYHLSCSREGVTRHSATKLIIDQAVRDAVASGAEWVHLGGGLGGAEDSLFAFKHGFGRTVLPFTTWRWVVRSRDYNDLCRAAGASGASTDTYFPAYRRAAPWGRVLPIS